MGEWQKDSDDLKLEALFRSGPIEDGGFSAGVVKRVRRRMWARRLTLPVAIGLGAILSAKPFVQLMGLSLELLARAPQKLSGVIAMPETGIAGLPAMLAGAALFATVLVLLRIAEDY